MAKKTAVRKMKEDEVPTSAPLSDVEQADAARASATTEATGGKEDDGETSETTSNRLPYPPRTKDGQNAYLALGQSIPSFLWVARARALGHSLTAEDVREIVAYDGDDEVTCAAPSGQCSYRFRPVRTAQINSGREPEYKDGSLRLDERVVSETNPQGIRYRGAYPVVPVNPKDRHSKWQVLPPVCRRDQQSMGAAFKASGWFVHFMDKASAEALVQSFNTALDKGRETYLARKDENARALGLVTEDGQRVERGGGGRNRGFNSPHRANAGRQGRDQRDPRERNFGNRG